MNKIWLLILGLPGITIFAASAASAEITLPSIQTLILPMTVIAVLIVLNGIYVAAEFAINGVRSTQMEEIAEDGNITAIEVLSVLDSRREQDQYIATAQLGITIASLGLGMYGEPQIAKFIEPYLALVMQTDPHEALIHTIGYIVSLSLLTYLHVVLGEMIPKSIALSSADKAALFLNRPMQVSRLFFSIPVRILNGIGNLLLRLLNVTPSATADLHSPEEIEQIVAESAEGGMLNEAEEDLILNIFTFNERQVHQIMTHRRKIQAIPLDISLEDLIGLVSKSIFSRFPVYEGDLDHIIGILHLKDLVRQQIRSKGSLDLRLLLRPAPTVPEQYPAEQLLTAFKRRRLHMAIVLDEFGGTAGLVTLEDLVEEIIGEVRDEFDRKEADPLIMLEPGVLEVSGRYLLDDLKEDIYLGDEDALPDVETVGGLIMTELGRPPAVSDEFELNDRTKFTVLAVDGLAVGRARIDYTPEEFDIDGESSTD